MITWSISTEKGMMERGRNCNLGPVERFNWGESIMYIIYNVRIEVGGWGKEITIWFV